MSILVARQGRNQNWHPDNLGRDVLRAWWTADDHGGTNMTDDGAGLISSWKDRIGGLAVTATTTARPTWASNSFNSIYAGLAFDGTATCLVATVFTSLPTGATAGEIWMLGSQTALLADATTRSVLRYGGTASDTIRIVERLATGSINQLRVGTGNNATVVLDTATDLSGSFIVGAIWDGATGQAARLNGANTTPASSTIAQLATGTTRIRIGATNGTAASAFWQGQVRHVFVTTALSSGQRQQLEGWMAWNSGLTSLLPANHPYRGVAP